MVMIAQMKDKKKLRQKIHDAVCQMYDLVSKDPHLPLHFPVGFNAAVAVGYPKSNLKAVPKAAAESFAGVAYHFKTNMLKSGDHVLDIGAGSGTDLFIASSIVGRKGKVVGIDITESMVKKAKKAAKTNGFSNVKIIKADAEKLPFKSGTFDVVISNGVINLVPDKQKVFGEIYRVLKPGGKLAVADIVLGKSISEASRQDPQLWAECVVGASLIDEYLKTIEVAGFKNIQVVETYDYFSLSSSETTREVANHYKAHSIILTARKGGD